jgi:hypothetical protein
MTSAITQNRFFRTFGDERIGSTSRVSGDGGEARRRSGNLGS